MRRYRTATYRIRPLSICPATLRSACAWLLEKVACVWSGAWAGNVRTGPFTDTAAFLRKATQTIQKAAKQLLQYNDGLRLLVLNVQSPDATFPHDIGIKLRELVIHESGGAVHAILLLHHYFIEG